MKTIALLLLLAFSLSSSSQSIDTAKLNSFFNALDEQGFAMGSLTIAKNGKILYQRALGYSFKDNVKWLRTDINTKYRIGSQTKMFTAVVIFQLVEEGKLDLDEKLSAYFPDLPNADKTTIVHLLSHRSGLHDYTEETNYQEWMDKPATQDHLLSVVREKGADFEPGTKTVYCNTNFLLLGYIIEKKLRMPYAAAVHKKIVSKIALKNTYYGQKIDINNGESASYKYAEGNWKKEKETDMSIHAGAGSMVSTSGDMVSFIEALFNNKLVKGSSLAKMKTFVDGIGMGLSSYMHGSKTGYGHNGRIEEFYSSVMYFPGEKISVSYITNGIVYPRKDIMDIVLKICFNEPVEVPFLTPVVLKQGDLDKYTGKYTMDQSPIEVNCTVDKNKLLLETRGKIFEVIPIGENYFMHVEKSGYFFEFIPGKNELLVKETDNVYYFKRSK